MNPAYWVFLFLWVVSVVFTWIVGHSALAAHEKCDRYERELEMFREQIRFLREAISYRRNKE